MPNKTNDGAKPTCAVKVGTSRHSWAGNGNTQLNNWKLCVSSMWIAMSHFLFIYSQPYFHGTTSTYYCRFRCTLQILRTKRL